MFRRAIYLVAAIVTFAVMTVTAHAEKRVALVLGNSQYKNTVSLDNPENDAADITAALLRLGFTVIDGINLEKREMERRIRDYANALKGADVGLFYYAGHGIQVNGKNYMAPVDAQLKSETDLDFEAVDVNLVLRQMERNSRVNLVFLDACRDNPLAEILARSLGSRSRSVSIGRGLAPVEKALGMMIAFATQPGNVALDGDGRNSPFTKALLNHIETEGLTVSDIMINVRKDVLAATDGKQVPWENSSLTGQFYFKAAKKTSSGDTEGTRVASTEQNAENTPAASSIPNTTFDHTFWTSIRDSDDPALFKEYLRRFPNGVFTPIAKAKLEMLMKEADADKSYSSGKGGEIKQAEISKHTSADDAGRSAQASPAVPGVDPAILQRQISLDTQTALKAYGCYTNSIDGIWGPGSQSAMSRFNHMSKLNLPVGHPDEATLNVVKAWRGGRCVYIAKKKTRSTSKKYVKKAPKKYVKKAPPPHDHGHDTGPGPGGGSGGSIFIGGGGGSRGGISIGIIGGGLRF